MCHHEVWPTSVGHPLSLISLSLDLFFKILLFEVAFLIFFFIVIFSPYFLQVGLLLQYVVLFQSGIWFSI